MRNLLLTSSLLAILAGIACIGGGVWGIKFTHNSIARENIVTPEDAELAGVPVRGPLTLKVQADIIRHHTLARTGGQAYAEMPRLIEKVDEAGNTVIGPDGKPVMVPNTARDLWITAMVLTTALNLGILTYSFSALVILLGAISVWTGVVFYFLSKRY